MSGRGRGGLRNASYEEKTGGGAVVGGRREGVEAVRKSERGEGGYGILRWFGAVLNEHASSGGFL